MLSRAVRGGLARARVVCLKKVCPCRLLTFWPITKNIVRKNEKCSLRIVNNIEGERDNQNQAVLFRGLGSRHGDGAVIQFRRVSANPICAMRVCCFTANKLATFFQYNVLSFGLLLCIGVCKGVCKCLPPLCARVIKYVSQIDKTLTHVFHHEVS